MRKLSLLMAAVLFAALAFWFWRPTAVAVDPVAAAPELKPAPAAVATHVAEATKPKKMTGSFHAKPNGASPEGNVIPFQVHDGVAIAYGDLILGEPDDPSLKEGYYEAPRPTLWDRPEIPYAIANDLVDQQRVKQAVDYFNKHTPVQFVPYDGQQPDGVVFETGSDNCYSLLGKQGGLQPIKIELRCDWVALVHEMMHVLGFVHEQSRPDRDRYLEILTDNIEDRFREQFAIVPESFMEASRQGAFDFHSVMLYSPTMFAKKGALTMRSRTGEAIAPEEHGLSPGDIEKLRELYHNYIK